MAPKYILSGYVEEALSHAIYDKLEDGTFSGKIPSCKGVVAFGANLRQCENELRATLEDWIFVGLRLNHRLPILGKINLNKGLRREPVDTV